MAIEIPTITDIYNKIKVAIFSYTDGELEVESHPFARSISKGEADILNDCYVVAQDSVAQTFSQNATDEAFLTAIAFDRTNNQIIRKDATFASGTLVVTATQSTDVPAGSQFITSDGQIYESQVDKTAITQTFLITSLERVSNYAIATLSGHLLGNAMDITFAGADQTEFNVTLK